MSKLMFVGYLLVSLIVCSCVAFRESQHEILHTKVKELLDLSSRKSIAKLNYEQYQYLLATAPRNYSVILMLTALSPSRQCQVCKAAFDEFLIVANSWKFANMQNSRLFFAISDYDESPKIFQALEQDAAPLFIHFSSKGLPKANNIMDLTRFGYSAEAIAKWIHAQTSIELNILRPPNYAATMLLALFMSFGAALLYFKRKNLELFFVRSTWAMISMGLIVCMISGQVFNHIKGPPFLHADAPNGAVNFIYPGGDYQFVAETFIVIIMYVAIVAGVLIINEVGDTPDASKRKFLTMGGLGLFSLFVCLVLSVFRRKYQGYPYSIF